MGVNGRTTDGRTDDQKSQCLPPPVVGGERHKTLLIFIHHKHGSSKSKFNNICN